MPADNVLTYIKQNVNLKTNLQQAMGPEYKESPAFSTNDADDKHPSKKEPILNAKWTKPCQEKNKLKIPVIVGWMHIIFLFLLWNQLLMKWGDFLPMHPKNFMLDNSPLPNVQSKISNSKLYNCSKS